MRAKEAETARYAQTLRELAAPKRRPNSIQLHRGERRRAFAAKETSGASTQDEKRNQEKNKVKACV